jgi:hypothetical protein
MMAMSFMATAYCNGARGGRATQPTAMIRHDWPARCPNRHPALAHFTAPNVIKGRKPATG